jgi:hypothetical protein
MHRKFHRTRKSVGDNKRKGGYLFRTRKSFDGGEDDEKDNERLLPEEDEENMRMPIKRDQYLFRT